MLGTVIDVFKYGLHPVPPLTWIGVSMGIMDLLGAFRLVVILRQLREAGQARALKENPKDGLQVENSFMKDVWTLFTVVFGGEAIGGAWLGFTPSFLISPIGPLLFFGAQVIVHLLPAVPPICLEQELPLATFDAFTRAVLVNNLIPPIILNHASPAISSSPYSLFVGSLIIANGGFFLVNIFGMLSPQGWGVSTPNELKPYGWTTLDIWIAPLMTCLFALLTNAQPFWTDLHASLLDTPLGQLILPVKALNADSARAVCASSMAILFTVRALWNFGEEWWHQPMTFRSPTPTSPSSFFSQDKKVIPRSKVDGKKRSKVKVQ